MRLAPAAAAVLLCAAFLVMAAVLDRRLASAQQPSDPGAVTVGVEQIDEGEIPWRGSVAFGKPFAGALFRGVQLPAEGIDFFTWDFPLDQSPNRGWRRWGTDTTVHALLGVISEYRLAHPGVGRVGIADLSRPHGGPFGKRFGGLGHASHQNGLDVDVLYPRLDGLELDSTKPSQINRGLAQDLVNRFVAAGATDIFIGLRIRLTGPRKVVQKLVHHHDHMHIRFSRGATAG
jgi:murein endopeptidase